MPPPPTARPRLHGHVTGPAGQAGGEGERPPVTCGGPARPARCPPPTAHSARVLCGARVHAARRRSGRRRPHTRCKQARVYQWPSTQERQALGDERARQQTNATGDTRHRRICTVPGGDQRLRSSPRAISAPPELIAREHGLPVPVQVCRRCWCCEAAAAVNAARPLSGAALSAGLSAPALAGPAPARPPPRPSACLRAALVPTAAPGVGSASGRPHMGCRGPRAPGGTTWQPHSSRAAAGPSAKQSGQTPRSQAPGARSQEQGQERGQEAKTHPGSAQHATQDSQAQGRSGRPGRHRMPGRSQDMQDTGRHDTPCDRRGGVCACQIRTGIHKVSTAGLWGGSEVARWPGGRVAGWQGRRRGRAVRWVGARPPVRPIVGAPARPPA